MGGEFGFDLPLDTLTLGGESAVPSFSLPSNPFGVSEFSTQGFFSGADTTAPNFDRFFSGSVPGTVGAPTGGSSDWFSSLFGRNTSPVSALAQGLGLGATGLGIANTIGAMNRAGQQEKVQTTGQNLATAAAQPAIGYGTQLVQDAQAGKLPQAMEASIAQWTQQAKADMRARLAHLGMSDSTTLTQYDNQIEQMAQAMRANLLFQEGSQGVAALGTGAQTGLGLAQSAGPNQALLNNLITQANSTLFGLQGMGARG